MSLEEIDNLIATKFFGLNVVTNTTKRGGVFYTIEEPYYFDFSGDLQLQNAVSPYSEQIEAAWPILEELHNRAWFWRLDSVHDGVICTIQNVKRQTFSIRAPTAPQAICEAALKTVLTTDVPTEKA